MGKIMLGIFWATAVCYVALCSANPVGALSATLLSPFIHFHF